MSMRNALHSRQSTQHWLGTDIPSAHWVRSRRISCRPPPSGAPTVPLTISQPEAPRVPGSPTPHTAGIGTLNRGVRPTPLPNSPANLVLAACPRAPSAAVSTVTARQASLARSRASLVTQESHPPSASAPLAVRRDCSRLQCLEVDLPGLELEPQSSQPTGHHAIARPLPWSYP
jgi:hypothetical protein